MNWRRLLALALVPYVGWLVVAYRYHFLDGVNLAIHETGHLLFSAFGDTLMLLGGTILQLAFPAAFAVHFLREGRRYEAAICGVWLAESLMYAARYLGDARARTLPLVGSGVHDWHVLLIRFGLLDHAEALGGILHVVASAGAVAALLLAFSASAGAERTGG